MAGSAGSQPTPKAKERVLNWLGKRVIALIGVGALAGAAAVSIAAAGAKEDLTAVLTGDLLVVSVAIFLAAVAAAVYAKPTYEAARALLAPPKMTLHDVAVTNSTATVESERRKDGSRVFYVGSSDRELGVKVTILGSDDADQGSSADRRKLVHRAALRGDAGIGRAGS